MNKKAKIPRNRGFFIILLIIFSIFIPAQAAFAQQTYTWTGGAGDGVWETPGNWAGGLLFPDAGDTAIFNLGATVTVNTPGLSIGELQVNSVILTLNLNNGSFATTATTLDGTINVSGDDINLGNITLNGNSDITSDNSITAGNINGLFNLTVDTAAGNSNITFNGAVTGADLVLNAGIGGNITFVNTANLDFLTVTAANAITFAPAATVAAGAVSINNSGLLTIGNGANFNLTAGSFTQNGSGAVNLGANITTANAAITFAGAVTLASNVTLATGAGAGDITFNNAVNGTQNLTLDAGAGSVNLNAAIGSITQLSNLTITTGSAITLPAINAANLNVTANGNIGQSDLIIVPGTTTLEAVGWHSITLNNLLNDFGTVAVENASVAEFVDINGIILGNITAGDLNVTAITGAIEQVSGATLLIGDASHFTAGGSITLDNDTNHFGLGVTLSAAGNSSIQAGSSGIIFDTADLGTNNFTVTSAGAVFGGPIICSGLLLRGTGNFTLDHFANNITTLAGDTTGNITFENPGAFTVGAVSGINGITGAASVTLSTGFGNLITVAENITTVNGNITFHNNVAIVLNRTISTGAGTGNITFNGTLTGDNLTLAAGTGNIDFNDSISLEHLSISNVNLATFMEDVITTGVGLTLTGDNFHFHEAVTIDNGGIVTIVNTGILTIDSDAVFVLNGGGLFSQSGVGGAVSLGADITTVNAAISFSGAVTLTPPAVAPITLTTGAAAGDITFSSTINGTQNLTLDAGAGNVFFNNPVGGATGGAALGNITITDALGVTFAPAAAVTAANVSISNSGLLTIGNGANFDLTGNFLQNSNVAVNLGANITTVNAPISFAGAVTLTPPAVAPITLATGAGAGNITFNNAVNGGQNLTLNAGAGNVLFNNPVGATGTLGNITITAAGVTFAANSTVAAGDVSINNSGTLAINSGANFTLTGSFTQNGIGNVNLGADIETANAPISFISLSPGTITLTTTPILLDTGTGAGGVIINNPINGGANLLTITAGAGNVALNATTSYSSTGTGGLDITTSSGSITVAGSLSAGSGNISLVSTTTGTTGTIELSGAVTTVNNGNVTITNGGQLTINSNANFDLTGDFLQDGPGVVVSSGDLITTGTIVFSAYSSPHPPVFFAGFPNSDVNIGTGGSTITFHGDVYIFLPGQTITFQNNLTSRNFIIYSGEVDISGVTLTTTQDFIAFGSGYNPNDNLAGQSGVAGLFAYNHALRPQPTITLDIIIPLSPPATINLATPGGFDGNTMVLDNATISVGRNFYVNGRNMQAPSWILEIPCNFSSANTFAEAYNMSVSGSNVVPTSCAGGHTNADGTMVTCEEGTWVAAAENVTAAASPDWATARHSLRAGANVNDFVSWDAAVAVNSEAGTITVFDNVIRVEINNGGDSTVLFENTNNEINNAIAANAIQINVGIGRVQLSPIAAFTNLQDAAAATALAGRTAPGSTDGQGDLAVFYLRFADANTWNTDASGTGPGVIAGTTLSTDMSGNQRNVIPNIFTPKGSTTFFFSLLDNRKNRLTHHGAINPFTAVTDFCRPVVVSITVGRDTDTAGPTNWKNYFEIRYSEPVNIGTAPGFTIASPNASNIRAQNAFAAPGDWGGHLRERPGFETQPPAGGGGWGQSAQLPPISHGIVEMVGFFEYPGTFSSGSTDGNSVTNSLFRNNAHSIRIYVVGYSPDNGVTWPGFMPAQCFGMDGSIAPPNSVIWNNITPPHWYPGTVLSNEATILANNFITDYRGNILNIHGYDVNPTFGARNPRRVVISHFLAPDPRRAFWVRPEIGPHFEAPDTRQVVVVSTNPGGVTDRFDFFIANTDTPWTATVGSHPFAYPAGQLGRGVRDSSISSDINRFRLSFSVMAPFVTPPFLGVVLPNLSFATSVHNHLFPSITNADDSYFAVSFTPPPFYDAFLPHAFSYYANDGMVTDLAGNLLRSVTSVMAINPLPPVIQYTIASVGLDRVYVRFSENVFHYNPGMGLEAITAANFDITTPVPLIPILSIESIENQGSGTGTLEAIFVLNRALTADDLLDARIEPSSTPAANASRFFMRPVEYRISNFAIGVIEPIWAMDSFDREEASSANITIFNFTGRDRLRASDITLGVQVNSGLTNPNRPVSIYFDADVGASTRSPIDIPASSGNRGRFWLPTLFRGFNTHANSGARALAPVRSTVPSGGGGLLHEFVIPGSDNAIRAGRDLEFIFSFDGLYAGYLSDPTDPRSVTPWRIPIGGIIVQRGGVTILNNVINVSRGERAILMYELHRTGPVTINVFNLSGNVVKTLVRGVQPAGNYSITWDGTNTAGRRVARGIYFIRVVGPDIDEFRKVMVVRD
ncbi:MAG: hypothetical protein FWC36_03730 [Spirochaetes bacterium]|nr:hypothetical protein [Spirochaetota bacterium]